MRKYLILFTILFAIVLTACGKAENNAEKPLDDDVESNSSRSVESEQELKLQVLKGDAEAGATIENNGLYKELDKLVKENPSIGEVNDFSIYVVNTIHGDKGNSRLVLLGINRLQEPIKNFEFDYTLGNKDNEYVWEKQKVKMNEAEAGIIEENSAIPIVLPLTEEQEALLKSLNDDNQVMSIEDFTFEKVD